MRFLSTINFLILIAQLSGAGVPLLVRQGRPVVDGVYINGYGPYRFLVDTGAQSNAVDIQLALALGLQATYLLEVVTPAGTTLAPAAKRVSLRLGTTRSTQQEVVFVSLDSTAQTFTRIHGVLGQEFLSQFDYLLDLRGRTMEFGKQERNGLRVEFETPNGQPVIRTSLGKLVLDSGVNELVLFDVEPDPKGSLFVMQTIGGLFNAGTVSGRRLLIGSREIRHTAAIAVPHLADPAADGLLPTNLFQSIYVSNSGRYVVFE